jgi:hypothetical protein
MLISEAMMILISPWSKPPSEASRAAWSSRNAASDKGRRAHEKVEVIEDWSIARK